jgi:hypothetical protein
MHHDPEYRQEKIDGLVARYRAGEFSTEVFTASLRGVTGMQLGEIADMVCQHIFVHQASLPYKRLHAGMQPIGDAAARVVERIKP